MNEQEVFTTDDGLTTKIIHSDNSETSIKMVSSCDTIRNPITGKLENNSVDRNKYSVFASSSVGCVMKCKFCYLTMKGMGYSKLSDEQILQNLKDAVLVQYENDSSISERYIKLCWMGMGEDQFIRPKSTFKITMMFLDWIFQNNYAKGLDGVDLSTVYPKSNLGVIEKFDLFAKLNKALEKYEINPNNNLIVHSQNGKFGEKYINRSRFRIFYSLHSAIQETREQLIPNATELLEAIPDLKFYSNKNERNVIFHHMFIEGQNDSEQEVDALIKMYGINKLQSYELRILRYNHCNNTPYSESDRFEQIMDKLSEHIPFLKVQISVGSEVKAACGQFIVRKFVDWTK